MAKGGRGRGVLKNNIKLKIICKCGGSFEGEAGRLGATALLNNFNKFFELHANSCYNLKEVGGKGYC